MNYYVKFSPENLDKTIEDIFLLFFPNDHIRAWEPGSQYHFEINYKSDKQKIIVEAISHWQNHIKIIETRLKSEDEFRSQLRRLIRLTFYKLLLKLFNEVPKPWGILTGVRPTKVVHRLLDSYLKGKKLESYLEKEFFINKDKINLIKEVAQVQRKLFKEISKLQTGINIYISIPFCPTRCLYCSFPGYEFKKYKKSIDDYLDALKKEIKEFYKAAESFNINVDSLYIGGGTPTVLSAVQLRELFHIIEPYINRYQIREYTLEAGRPDTIDMEKLYLAKSYGVTRISVNPQTMQEKTLSLIGRYHDLNQIYGAVEMVHKLNLKLNMDLILGLPDEDAQLVADSIKKVVNLKPHNITVHTLAIKTASKLRKLDVDLPASVEVFKMHNVANKILREKGYKPYYLYRQKRILGDLENTGYTLEGEESWYNVMIMEERQTIIGFGAGAASKFINKENYDIYGVYYNPKDTIIYSRRENLLKDKVNLLCSLFKEEKRWQ